MKAIDLNQSYTFSKFFELKIPAKDLCRAFGYSFERKRLNLPAYAEKIDRVRQTQARIEEILPHAGLGSEAARRELLIAPLLFDLVHYTRAEVNIEYTLKVNDQLQGTLDYLLEAPQRVLVVEAKKEDLDLGMTQLCAELIALDQWETDIQQDYWLGGVTTGKIWEFAKLDRQHRHLEQGLESYRVPEDLEPLMRILIQALVGA